ncbi:MAG: PxKF domain-containing protein, partial [Chloroflexi bacterium]|nr:PxKF domain-containing protein [Chloroflexota bacterium]
TGDPDSQTVTVHNVAPTVTAGLNQNLTYVLGGTTVSLSPVGTFTDPAGSYDSYTASIDWGDLAAAAVCPPNSTSCALTPPPDVGSVSASHTYASPGSYSVTLDICDEDGGCDDPSLTVKITYDYAGFFPPLLSPPGVNLGKAGKTYPIKWQLSDANDLYVSALSAVSYVGYKQVSCLDYAFAEASAVDPALTSGTSGLRYDSTANQYIYTWQTAKSMAGKCYVFVLKLNDGTTYLASFSFW